MKSDDFEVTTDFDAFLVGEYSENNEKKIIRKQIYKLVIFTMKEHFIRYLTS